MIPFPFSAQTPVAYPDPPPASADVVVVGGGIIGVMTGWHLAKAGLRAVVVEKGRVAGEQSSRNWGWIRVQGRHPSEIPIAIEAGHQWRGIAATIGEDIGLRQTGVMYLANTVAHTIAHENWLATARPYDLGSRLLSTGEVAGLIPLAATHWRSGLWTASDMRAEPWLAVPALARAAVRDGLIIVEDCAVRGLDIAAGRIAGVVTEAGRITAPAVVVAGGAWSSLLLRRHGIDIPQLSVRATVVATEPMEEVFAGGAVDARLAFRRRVDGGYSIAPDFTHDMFVGRDAFRNLRQYLPQLLSDPMGTRFYPAAPRGYPDAWSTPRRWSEDTVSPFEEMRVLNPGPGRGLVTKLLKMFAQTFPTLPAPQARAAWGGMIDSMPDVLPVVDTVADLPGLTIATGMSGHGFGIGPAFGRIAAALASGTDPGHDLSSFRLSRFGPIKG